MFLYFAELGCWKRLRPSKTNGWSVLLFFPVQMNYSMVATGAFLVSRPNVTICVTWKQNASFSLKNKPTLSPADKMPKNPAPLKGKYLEAANLYSVLNALSLFNLFFKLPLDKVLLAKGFTY